MDETREPQVGPPVRRRRWALALAAAVWLAWAAGGCTPEKKYKVLSFFFDGVPNPNAPQLAAGQETDAGGQPVVRATVFVHKPYADGQCNACHAGDTSRFESFSKISPQVCLDCHKDTPRQYRVMHGPVAAVECNFCHNPHESAIPGMLRDPAPRVCVQCHDRELLTAPPAEHLDQKADCLSCHVGHGSEKRMLLRQAVALTTQPAATPATTRPGEGGGE